MDLSGAQRSSAELNGAQRSSAAHNASTAEAQRRHSGGTAEAQHKLSGAQRNSAELSRAQRSSAELRGGSTELSGGSAELTGGSAEQKGGSAELSGAHRSSAGHLDGNTADAQQGAGRSTRAQWGTTAAPKYRNTPKAPRNRWNQMKGHPAEPTKKGLKIEMTDPTDLDLSFKTMFSVQEGPSGGHRRQNKSQAPQRTGGMRSLSKKGKTKKQNTNHAIQIATKTTIRNFRGIELMGTNLSRACNYQFLLICICYLYTYIYIKRYDLKKTNWIWQHTL